MRKLRALDLYCGAGGATRGLQLAGFHVTGVDIRTQPNYVGDDFILGDAITIPLTGFDFIWASPPCQKYSLIRMNTRPDDDHPDLVAPTRERLIDADVPSVIENVHGAPLDKGSICLCGKMFGLKTYRHRWFECRPMLLGPHHRKHTERCPPAGRLPSPGGYVSVCGKPSQAKANLVWSGAMGIDWMSMREISQAIPPAYAKWIGEQMMPHVKRSKDAEARNMTSSISPNL